MGRHVAAAWTAAIFFLILPIAVANAADTRAGVGVADATWHVGASAGQFTDDYDKVYDPTDETPDEAREHVDPHTHTTKKRMSDGVALRTSVRAIVFEDTQGDRVAIVAHDLYLPQDLLTRRITTLARERGLDLDHIAVTASHNHNTPYYSTPGWGTAIFQDFLDVRFYEYMAQRAAAALERASKTMVPVRMGATTRTFDAVQGHTYGPKIGDDGAPAGQPYSYTTRQLTVVRLDDVSNRSKPQPLANWVVFGLHPEFTWGYDLINGDFTHAAARIVDRQLGTVSVFSQRETGTSGPHKDERVHAASTRREFEDNGFNGLDRGSRLIADAILAARKDIETSTPENPNAFQPFVEDFDVAAVSQRFAPPATRPVPGKANCNTAAFFHADPRVIIPELPECKSQKNPVTDALGPATAAFYDQMKAAGVPIPDTLSIPSLTGVEETAAVHLMAMRLGDTGITFCPCEQFTATALNIQTRLDRVPGNQHNGWDWTAQKTPSGRDWCVPAGEGMWSCANPGSPSTDLAPISDLTLRRLRAQIHNDAKGWETELQTLGAESEPVDPAQVKGNFTHEEYTEHGYRLVISVGMANDYWGYVPEYREMRAHDHYRKSLNGLGPHGSDFLATRLSRMGASLNGGAAVTPSPLDLAYTAEQARAQAVADGLGTAGNAGTAAYERQLPADGGEPEIVTQPKDVERFAAANLSFVGGSNWTDLPDVRVERRVDSEWVPYGDMTGDVQLMLRFPKHADLPAYRAGSYEWRWTAGFEAFASDIRQPDLQGTSRDATPAGTYRFVVNGKHRPATGADPEPYRLVSESFTVKPWDGLRAEDLRVDGDGRVSFRTPTADYPDTYTSPFRWVTGEKMTVYGQEYCRKCTFRPWADKGSATSATVTVRSAGRDHAVTAVRDAATGRWRTKTPIPPRAWAHVAAGDLHDEFGNTNGTASDSVRR